MAGRQYSSTTHSTVWQAVRTAGSTVWQAGSTVGSTVWQAGSMQAVWYGSTASRQIFKITNHIVKISRHLMKRHFCYGVSNASWSVFLVRCIVRHTIEAQKVGHHVYYVDPYY